MELDAKIKAELNMAEQSHQEGNEGMARVCARRAAGLALRKYITDIGEDRPDLNNFEILSDQKIRKILPAELHTWLDHLSMRVDINHKLPAGIDLIADTRNFIEYLNSRGVIN